MWIAIAAFTDEQWRAVATGSAILEWLDDPRFDRLSNRRANEDALDDLVSRATGSFDGADPHRLQAAEVAGRPLPDGRGPLRKDPQASPSPIGWSSCRARHLAGNGFRRASTACPAYAGGIRPPGPNYGEDTQRVRRFFGMTAEQVTALRAAGVV